MLKHFTLASLLLLLVASTAHSAPPKAGQVLRVGSYSITAMPYLGPMEIGPLTYRVDDDTRVYVAYVRDRVDSQSGSVTRRMHVKRGTWDDVRPGRRVMILGYRGRAMQVTVMPVAPLSIPWMAYSY